jgi:hypothetical protein
MRSRDYYTLFAVLTASAACATGNRPTTTAGPARWSGSFRTVGAASSAILNTSSTDSLGSAFGSITVTSLETTPPTSHVDLTVSAQSMSGRELAWAIFTGPCGAGTPPVASLQEFPPLTVSSGNARVSTDLRFQLSPSAEYHANVYASYRANDVANVLMCTNLSLGR